MEHVAHARMPRYGRRIVSAPRATAYVLDPVDPFEILSLEFLQPGHPVNALAPASPLQVTLKEGGSLASSNLDIGLRS